MRDATVSDFLQRIQESKSKKIKKFFFFFFFFFFFLMLGGGRWWVRGAIVREFL